MENLSYKLEIFEGPLDLLLHLISKNKLDIHEIEIYALVSQYLDYIETMQAHDIEIAGEFIEMAARLIHIKTTALLPKHEDETDPMDELVGEILEYQVCRELAEMLNGMSGGFSLVTRMPLDVPADKSYSQKHDVSELAEYYYAACARGKRKLPPPVTLFEPIVAKKIISVPSKIIFLLRSLWNGKSASFSSLLKKARSKSEIVATFLALLELVKTKRIGVKQKGSELQVQLNK